MVFDKFLLSYFILDVLKISRLKGHEKAEADLDAEDQLNALDTKSASRSGRSTSSAASSTSSIFTNFPISADYNLNETLPDETLAEVVPDSQACDKTEHNLSPDVPNNSKIVKGRSRSNFNKKLVTSKHTRIESLHWMPHSYGNP
ncbi:hypothetical protein JTB14_022861 [Gonioctena quinquepunctata]|nr:hypothetical protein JTB14_022861 [Gonioctena quinquepunctata]